MKLLDKCWLVDAENMTCRNVKNDLEFTFEPTVDNGLVGHLSGCEKYYLDLLESLDCKPAVVITGLAVIARYYFAQEYYKGFNPYAKIPELLE